MSSYQIEKTQYKVSDFINWQKHNCLVLSPSFQRRAVWDSGAKSYLIDTIVRGLPIPLILLREKSTDLNTLQATREVVDGQQRIRTIISFVAPGLLEDYKEAADAFTVNPAHNKAISRKLFAKLDLDTKHKILDYQFSVQVFPHNVDDRDILQIFARINSTGIKLNRQELRNAEFYGAFKTLAYRLSTEQLFRWRSWGIFKESNISRMDEVELTSEFFILMLEGLTGKSQTAIENTYRKYDDIFKESRIIKHRFQHVMDTIEETLGENLKYSPFRKRTLFFILFASFYHALYGIESSIDKTPPNKISASKISKIKSIGEKLANQSLSEEILSAATRRTTNIKERKILFQCFTAD